MSISSRLSVVALFVFSALVTACDGPCQNLAQKICECEPNQTREQSCLVNVDFATRDPIANEDELCEQLLETCTCDAIDRGDFEACGLALPGSSS